MYLILESCCSACAEREAQQEETPPHVQRCVRAVAKQYGGDVKRAFSICVAMGQKRGTLKKGTIEPTKKGKSADTTKIKDPEHAKKTGEYEKFLAKARKKRSEAVSLRSDMLKILGETEKGDWKVTGDQGATSTGQKNKPAKKTPEDDVPLPNVASSGRKERASEVETPPNKPQSPKPMKPGVSPPNVTGAGAVEDMKRMARIYAGIDSKYELGATPKPTETDDTIVSESAQSDDPILKLALEGLRNPIRSHPFE
jgi:hypothetical protein